MPTLDLVEGHVRITGHVQPAIQEHAPVARREHEAVAVEPFGMVRAVFEGMAEEHRADFRAAQRQAEVPALAGFDGVNGQPARDGGGFGEEFVVQGRHMEDNGWNGWSALRHTRPGPACERKVACLRTRSIHLYRPLPKLESRKWEKKPAR
jgi:hypothetical protein